MAKVKKLKSEESLLGMGVSDQPITKQKNRDLRSELFPQKDYRKEILDNYEEKMGIRPKETKKQNLVFKNKIFKLDYANDRDLLNTLMNSPKYTIVYTKDTFTATGEYVMFTVYSEDLDYKEPQKDE